MRFFIFLAAILLAVIPAYGQNLHFVAIAWVAPDKQAQYDQFNELVAPIWARHGMDVVLRAKVVGALEEDGQTDIPTEITVLRIASRQQFQEYIVDPAYRSIRSMRTDAVDQMIELEGADIQRQQHPLLKTAPQFALVQGDIPASAAAPILQLATSQAGSIKGPVPPQYAAKPPVTLFALSYDDNPMAFGGDDGRRSSIFIVQRAN